MQSLKRKHVVITGASGGLGEKIAYEVAKRGGTVTLIARTVEKLNVIAQQIKDQYKVECYTYELDVSQVERVQHTFTQITQEVGSIDILVNNAGFGIFESVEEAKLEDIEAMFQVNVLGLIACTKMVLPHMIKRNEGHIINIASQAGKLATPKSSGYAATKHAVLGFTNSLRMELSKTNVYVTAVNPGPIQTNFFTIADSSGKYEKSVEKFMLDPNMVAKKIVNAMMTKKREINLPGWMGVGSTLYQLAPKLVEKLAGNAFHRK
ncbi:SDR family oxidoreductase [Bacillus sp. CGMCC 1.16541]|uniref:SDR family NAD(P)-dependent oxidoreductase n=1 Tax=Bacillus sp. CGMCC 1.16541 TaxID=2185143 RepID=UPI000D73C106|nr:SDR family oxidoreductase [Bacillus sp. CGMCC 1.16541]